MQISSARIPPTSPQRRRPDANGEARRAARSPRRPPDQVGRAGGTLRTAVLEGDPAEPSSTAGITIDRFAPRWKKGRKLNEGRLFVGVAAERLTKYFDSSIAEAFQREVKALRREDAKGARRRGPKFYRYAKQALKKVRLDMQRGRLPDFDLKKPELARAFSRVRSESKQAAGLDGNNSISDKPEPMVDRGTAIALAVATLSKIDASKK